MWKHFLQVAGTRNGLEKPIIEISLAASKGTHARKDHVVPNEKADEFEKERTDVDLLEGYREGP